MSHYPPAKLLRPQPPLYPDRACCAWCGCALPKECPDDNFGSDSCQSAWLAWTNRVTAVDETPVIPSMMPPSSTPRSVPLAYYHWAAGRVA